MDFLNHSTQGSILNLYRWDSGSISVRRTPRARNGNPLQYSCLESSMDRGAWGPTAHGVRESQRWQRACVYVHTHTHTHTHTDCAGGRTQLCLNTQKMAWTHFISWCLKQQGFDIHSTKAVHDTCSHLLKTEIWEQVLRLPIFCYP